MGLEMRCFIGTDLTKHVYLARLLSKIKHYWVEIDNTTNK